MTPWSSVISSPSTFGAALLSGAEAGVDDGEKFTVFGISYGLDTIIGPYGAILSTDCWRDWRSGCSVSIPAWNMTK